MSQNIKSLTKKAEKHLRLVLTHTETLEEVLEELNQATNIGKEVTITKATTKPTKESLSKTKVGGKNQNNVYGLPTKEIQRGRGRPSKVEASLDNTLKDEVLRIRNHIDEYNKWWDDSEKNRNIWKIENGTYLCIIEGFYSSGETGRYGVTTRLYINPSSSILPDELKGDIHTTAVNRIRYVENKEQGLEYIERQKHKMKHEFFNETIPSIISNHGKKGSVYAFHLDDGIRNQFKHLQTAVYKIPSLEKQVVRV